jgi:hypothetical protein
MKTKLLNVFEESPEIQLLNCMYLLWMDDNKDDTNILFLLKFKKKIKENCEGLYVICNDYIDVSIRRYYLMEKYYKKWMTYHINNKVPVNNTDLEFNDINNDKYYINYIDYKERKRYLFSENDFCKIIRYCLYNSYEFDIEPSPIHIRNPYTNKEFSKTELRSINSKVRYMPIVWLMLVDSDYDMLKFKLKYYTYLLDLCIPNYVEKLIDEDLIDYLIDIFEFSNIIYCNKCLESKIELKTRKIKNILIGWLRYLKLNKSFDQRHINYLTSIYDKLFCKCSNFSMHSINSILNLNNFMSGLDFRKPLFHIGYKNKKDKKYYFRRKRDENRRKERKKINKY